MYGQVYGAIMSNNNLTIDLKRKIDKNGRTFFVAKLKCPITIDCEKGAVFLVFTSETNEEQLQIALMDKED